MSFTPPLIWLSFILLITLGRAIAVYRYNASDNQETKYTTWLIYYLIIEIASGLAWASSAIFLPFLSEGQQFFIYFAAGGMLMGATVILAPVVSTYIAFAIPFTVVYVITTLLLESHNSYAMASMAMVYCIVLIYITLLMNRRIIEIMNLSEKNHQLLDDIQNTNSELQLRITEKEQIEKKLLHSRNELSRIIEHMQDTYFRLDSRGRIITISPSVEPLLSYRQKDLSNTQFVHLFSGQASFDDFMELIRANRGQVRNFETQLVTQEEHPIWVSINAQYFYDKQNNIGGIEGTMRDVSENRMAADALFKARNQYKSLYEYNLKILEHAPVGIITLDENNRVSYLNPVLLEMTGNPKDTASPATGREIASLPSIQRAKLGNVLSRLTQGSQVEFVTEFTSMFDKTIVMEVKGVPIIEKSRYQGSLVFITDVTKQAQEKEDLSQAKTQAELNNQSKSLFIEKLSAELRSPLADILGISETLIQDQRHSELIHEFERIHSAGQSILDYINTVSSVATLQESIKQEESNATNLETFIKTTITPLQRKATEVGTQLEIHTGDNTPRYINIDYRWFHNIFTHILNDFIANGESGEIKVNINFDEKHNLYIQLYHSKYKVSAFYFNGPSNDQNEPQGNYNINLSICRQLIESLGGKAWTEQMGKQGSMIHIVIPLQSTDVETESNPEFSHLNILLVEDNKASQAVLSSMLQNLGHNPILAESGKIAIEQIGKLNLDLVLMDINLPDIDGMETTRAIRAMDHKNAKLPIVAITGSSIYNREKWLNAGIDSYLLKPVSLNDLSTAINRIFA
ncbi:MAG: response regulator [Gammaproteobacteria bacterium]|nr:response regulator [Gammaproteobacteria bacterium]